MYFNFQQNRVNRSVIIVHTNAFAKNPKWHKFATTNDIFYESIISDMHHCKVYTYINFQQIRVVDQSKPCSQIYLQIITSFINLQLLIVILKKID